MSELIETIEQMTPEQREGALLALDAVSRPLTPREIEGAMLGKGVSRSQRRIITAAIKGLHIVAVVGPEHG